jgi:hypothetical protein
MESEWKKVEKIELDNLFDEIFDVNKLSIENLKLFEEAKLNSQHFGGHWQDYVDDFQLFKMKVEFLEDLGYLPTDLI